ncbi:hypothetical protein TSUD_258860 [Trifolium subterraneum]|uniref:POP1 C-terminal domain-containing protein n=1 Tax=Trifolium subterraneum TaxID=3900 RepID=A0A2Z6MWC1_TRISU|nr:hypothetical protein TSUD_258860 [Trifolium subterraneum]
MSIGSVKSEVGLKLSDSAMKSYFKENSSGKWEMQIPDDSIGRQSHRWPIGFVTSACVQGSKRLSAEGFCEAVLLSHLREEQWKEMPVKQRRSEIYLLVRNLRSVAYRLALASIALEYQENDIEFFLFLLSKSPGFLRPLPVYTVVSVQHGLFYHHWELLLTTFAA